MGNFEKIVAMACLFMVATLTSLLCTVFSPLTLAGVALIGGVTCLIILYIIE